MLLVQEFLKNHTFGELIEKHGVYPSFSKSGHKFSLNYDMIEAEETDLLAQQCRGLILAQIDGSSLLSLAKIVNDRPNYNHICPGDTVILAYPMNRFFNYGQGCAFQIDWNDKNLSIMEKLDGTLIIVYNDMFTKQWCAATRAVPEADLIMDNGIFTFRTLFEKALKDTTGKTFEEFTNKLNQNITYCFELTTPYNRIVVDYKECRVTLISARSTSLNKEFDLYGMSNAYTWMSKNEAINSQFISDKDKEYLKSRDIPDDKDMILPVLDDLEGVPYVRTFKYNSINELLDWVSSLNPMESEGVVVMDADFNRIKIKNANYVAANKMRDNLGASERNCVEVILHEKEDDIIPLLPEEIVKNLLRIKKGLQQAIKDYDNTYAEAKAKADSLFKDDKRTFALLITENKEYWTAPFFAIFGGKAVNMKDFIMKNKKDGSWSDSFLDKLLDMANKK